MICGTLRRVVEQISNVTRYPEELLTVDADLENDLGIDSVKNLEIVLALGEEFSLDLTAEVRDPSIRTIGQVVNWIDSLLNRSPMEEEVSANFTRYDSPPDGSQMFSETLSTSQSPLVPPHFLSDSPSNDSRARSRSGSSRPLEGRVALVTGSGRGVGRNIVRLLSSRGAHVIVNSFHSRELGEQTAAEIRAQGGEATHIWGSIANPVHVDRIFNQIVEQFGELDILVCNASDGRIGPFMELTAEDWERAFRTNVTGHHQCAMRASHLMRSGRSSIVTLSAVGATRYISGLGSQGVVKAAVESMTRYLACELGQFGIRVNCVAGGPVYGDLLSKFSAAEVTQRHWESFTPDGKLCSPMDLANAIGFLVSDEASGINGSVWMVDHGFSAVADGRSSRAHARRVLQPTTV
ncbi:MAG: SDR family oxidoreductase [Pirellulaceae bacterium]|nr:SDR family oxidoreductase [Pirellulaceae bacterium]